MAAERAPASLPPAIAVEHLSKRFEDSAHALRDVTFAVREGEIFALLGANGAGKSTLVRILATLLRPTSGSASVAGVDVIDRPAEARRRMGVALQDVGVDPAQRVRKLLHLHARLHGRSRRESRSRVSELLTTLQLDDVADRRIGTLSGGMRRRMDLALTLVEQPSALLLDEPTLGLDPAARRELWREIRELRATGVTVLLTTQHLDEAEWLADRVAILVDGEIADEGSPAELTRRLAHAVLEATFADRSQAARAAALLGPAASVAGSRLRAPLAGKPEAVGDVLVQIRALGLSLTALTVSPPTLEDVFLATTAPQPGS